MAFERAVTPSLRGRLKRPRARHPLSSAIYRDKSSTTVNSCVPDGHPDVPSPDIKRPPRLKSASAEINFASNNAPTFSYIRAKMPIFLKY